MIQRIPVSRLHRSWLETVLSLLATLALIMYPKSISLPYLKPYLVILALVGAALLYWIIRIPTLLFDKSLIIVGLLSLTSSISMFARSGFSTLYDFVWFNYFVAVMLAAYLLIKARVMHGLPLEKLTSVIVVSSFAVCAVEFYEIYSGHLLGLDTSGSMPGTGRIESGFRPASLIGNANPLATFCGAVAVFAFNGLIVRASLIGLATYLVNFAAAFLTLSRGGCVALLSGLCASVILHCFSSKRRTVPILVLTVFLCFLPIFLGLRYTGAGISLSDRARVAMSDENSLYRIDQWKGAMRDLLADYGALAFGMGPGSAAGYYTRGLQRDLLEYLPGTNTFDSTPISILYQYGLIGLIISVVPLVWLAAKVIRCRDANEYWRIGVSVVIITACASFEIFPRFECSYILFLCLVWPNSRRQAAKPTPLRSLDASDIEARVATTATRD